MLSRSAGALLALALAAAGHRAAPSPAGPADGGALDAGPSAAALADGGPGDSPAELFALAAYRGRAPMPLGEGSVYNGVPLQVFELDVDEPVAAVEAQYMRQFQALKLGVLPGAAPQPPGARYLSYHPRHSKRSLTLVLTPAGRHTHILASLSEPAAIFKARATYPAGLPEPGNVSQLVVHENLDAHGHSRAISFVVPDRSPDEVLTFFERRLSEEGFAGSARQSLGGPQGGNELFARGGENLNLVVDAAGPDGGASVSLMWIQP